MNANHWIGIPYREMDCYQLVIGAADDLFDIEYPCMWDYAENPSRAIDEALAGDWRWKELSEPTPGCVVLLSTYGRPRHVGLYLGDDSVLHAHRKIGSCIQHLDVLRQYYEVEGFYTWAA